MGTAVPRKALPVVMGRHLNNAFTMLQQSIHISRSCLLHCTGLLCTRAYSELDCCFSRRRKRKAFVSLTSAVMGSQLIDFADMTTIMVITLLDASRPVRRS